MAALIGGTVSALTGGKFASGALTAAFGRAFNSELHRVARLWEKTVVEQIKEAYAAKGIAIEIIEQAEIAVRLPNGAVVNAVADYAYVVDGVVHFGEVKSGLFAKLTANQKVVYSAIRAGRVFFRNAAQSAALGLAEKMPLLEARLVLHAAENGRAWRQVGRLMPFAERQSLKKVAGFLGGSVVTGVTLFFEMSDYDPVDNLHMSLPASNPSASFDMN